MREVKGTKLYFKFYKDDPLVTTLEDIHRSLTQSTKQNREFMLERLEHIIESPDDLRVFIED